MFLMDEPLSNLDATLRVQTRADIVALQQRLGDDDALRDPRPGRGDDDGRPHRRHEQGVSSSRSRRPRTSTSEPANTFVARFLGSPGMNLIPGVAAEATVAVAGGDGPAAATRLLPLAPVGRSPIAGVRPEAPPPRSQRQPRGLGRHRRAARRRGARHRHARRRHAHRRPPGGQPAEPGARRARADRRRPAALHLFDVDGPETASDDRPGGDRLGGPGVCGEADGSAKRCSAYRCSCPRSPSSAVFVFYPFAENFKLALYENPPFPGLPSRYVGLHQIGHVLASTAFAQSLVSTLLFVVMVVPLGLFARAGAGRGRPPPAPRGIADLPAHLLLDRRRRSVAVAAVIFGTLMDPVVGLLPWLGHQPAPGAPGEPDLGPARRRRHPIWQFLGLSFIIMSAGLQSVPDEILEAAAIDGAAAWTRLLAGDRAAALPHHLLRRGDRHHLRLPDVRRRSTS